MPAFAKYIWIASRVRPEAQGAEAIGRRNLTTEDKQKHVATWKRLRLTKIDYAKRIGVSERTFAAWTAGKSLGEHGQNSARPTETRSKALEMYRQGIGPRAISRALGIPEGTVYGWVGLWKLEGVI